MNNINGTTTIYNENQKQYIILELPSHCLQNFIYYLSYSFVSLQTSIRTSLHINKLKTTKTMSHGTNC